MIDPLLQGKGLLLNFESEFYLLKSKILLKLINKLPKLNILKINL